MNNEQNIINELNTAINYSECYQHPFIVAWWSAGITSAVACKIALELYDNVELYYIHIDTAHEDNERFRKDCEKWYGKKMHQIKSKEYKDQFDVIEKTRVVNTPQGAPCTKVLKKEVRYELEKKFALTLFNKIYIKNQVWGYEFESKEVNRAIRFLQQYPDTHPLFPLIEKGLTKNVCAGIIEHVGIELPEMYKLGFTNNNCIGCVKGGMAYWNRVRIHFPDKFNRMALLEREIGHSCINGLFLDELRPEQGRSSKEVMPNCGNICEVDFADIPDKNLDAILSGAMSIYDAV